MNLRLSLKIARTPIRLLCQHQVQRCICNERRNLYFNSTIHHPKYINAMSTTTAPPLEKTDTSAQKDDHIDVPVTLFVDDQTRHYIYFGRKRTASIHKSDNWTAGVQVNTRIENGRGKALTLDEASFELVDCPTSLTKEEFYAIQKGDATAVQKYYDEVEDFIKSELGCDEVHFFHQQVRNAEKLGQNGVQGYAGGAPHTDSSTVTADQLALKYGTAETHERYVYLNLWRNIADEPIENDHLAMLDERTTAKPDDYIVRDLFGPNYEVVQYELSARHADHHKWYYFPAMHRNEAILFKQNDSDWTKQGRISFHMSVNDSKIESYRPRESIELRMMCLWKNTGNGLNSMPTAKSINANMIKNPLQVAEESSVGVGWLNPFRWLKRRLFVSKYSGNPEDYLRKFCWATNFNRWPAGPKTWALQKLRTNSDDISVGIKILTKAVVDDPTGYLRTKSFSYDEKQEIVDFLLNNEQYMEVVKQHCQVLLEKN